MQGYKDLGLPFCCHIAFTDMFHCTCEDVRGNGGSPKNISPNGQRTHENMLNIISHRGNANGNPNGILLHSWNGKLPSVGEKPFSFAKSSWVGEVHCVLQNQRKPETVLMGLRIQVNKVALQISRQTSSKFTMPPSYLLSPPPGVVFPHKAMSPSTHEWGGGASILASEPKPRGRGWQTQLQA